MLGGDLFKNSLRCVLALGLLGLLSSCGPVPKGEFEPNPINQNYVPEVNSPGYLFERLTAYKTDSITAEEISTRRREDKYFTPKNIKAYSIDEVAILDFGIEVRAVPGGLVYYRGIFYPLSVTPAVYQAWPTRIVASSYKADLWLEFRLPDDRSLSNKRSFKTEWTLCLKCLNVDEQGRSRTLQNETLKRMRGIASSEAHTSSNPISFDLILFPDSKPPSVQTGVDAIATAEALGAALLSQAETLKPARKEYDNLVKAYKNSTIKSQLKQACGNLNVNGEVQFWFPNKTFDDYYQEIRDDAHNIEHFQDCAIETLGKINLFEREREIADLELREAVLAEYARIPSGDRTAIDSFDAEKKAVEDMINQAHADHADFINDVQRVERESREYHEERRLQRARSAPNVARILQGAIQNFQTDMRQINQRNAAQERQLRAIANSPQPKDSEAVRSNSISNSIGSVNKPQQQKQGSSLFESSAANNTNQREQKLSEVNSMITTQFHSGDISHETGRAVQIGDLVSLIALNTKAEVVRIKHVADVGSWCDPDSAPPTRPIYASDHRKLYVFRWTPTDAREVSLRRQSADHRVGEVVGTDVLPAVERAKQEIQSGNARVFFTPEELVRAAQEKNCKTIQWNGGNPKNTDDFTVPPNVLKEVQHG